MNWIRIATKMKGDPRLGSIAGACKVRIHEAVGLVCCTLMEFPDHARSGDVAAVPDVVLEQWALWTGKPGVFAQAFRAHLCDETGVVRSWEKHNGSALRRAESDIERKRAARTDRERASRKGADVRSMSAGQNADVRRKSDGSPTEVRDVSSVDETRRKETTASAVAAAVVSRPPAAAATAEDRIAPLGFTTPTHRDAALGYLRAAAFPEAVAAQWAGLLEGLGAPGGFPVSVEVLGQALHEMQVANVRTCSAATLAKFLPRVGEAASVSPLGEGSWDSLIAREEEAASVA